MAVKSVLALDLMGMLVKSYLSAFVERLSTKLQRLCLILQSTDMWLCPKPGCIRVVNLSALGHVCKKDLHTRALHHSLAKDDGY